MNIVYNYLTTFGIKTVPQNIKHAVRLVSILYDNQSFIMPKKSKTRENCSHRKITQRQKENRDYY